MQIQGEFYFVILKRNLGKMQIFFFQDFANFNDLAIFLLRDDLTQLESCNLAQRDTVY